MTIMPEAPALEYPFSSLTLRCLKRAGWRPGRTISTVHWESVLKSAGNPTHHAVVSFLKSFGGLRIEHPHGSVDTITNYFIINPSVAAELFPISDDGLYDLNNWAGKPLCAIGTAARDYALLVMDAEGKLYAAEDDLFYLISNSGPEGIEALCTNRPWHQIH